MYRSTNRQFSVAAISTVCGTRPRAGCWESAVWFRIVHLTPEGEHTLLEGLADATLAGTREAYLAELAAVPLLIIDDLGMRKLPHTAA